MNGTERRAYEDLPANPAGVDSPAFWGMLLVIATEAALFAALFLSYFLLRGSHAEWPPFGMEKPKLKLPLIMTALLLGSSIPIYIADRGIARGSVAQLRLGFAAAFALGLAFLAVQVFMEYPEKKFSISTNVYGSLFFTITGLHGLHVLGGLLMNAVVQLRAWLGHFGADRHQAVQNVSMYWHFVDVVWVVILTSIYLLPHIK